MSPIPHTTLRRPSFRACAALATLLFALSGCAEVPIKKTNCWTTAPTSAAVSRNATSPLMLISAPDAVPPKHDAVCV